jgi:hypothetical protein
MNSKVHEEEDLMKKLRKIERKRDYLIDEYLKRCKVV